MNPPRTRRTRLPLAANQWATATQIAILAVVAAPYAARAAAVPVLLTIIVGTVLRHFLLVLWTWMWGPVATCLAVPIAMMTAGVLQHGFSTAGTLEPAMNLPGVVGVSA